MKNKPLFKNPFSEVEPEEIGGCGPGRKRVKGFTRKDGRKVAPFCTKIKPPTPTLSSVVTAPDARKQLVKMAETQGCAEVIKKLEFLGRVSNDDGVKKRVKAESEWLKAQPSCKIQRPEPKSDGGAK